MTISESPLIDSTIEYDEEGRMKFHPDYHDRHGKKFTEDELIYLCTYWGVDDVLSLSFALGRTVATLNSKMVQLRKTNEYELYKNRGE